MRNLLMRIAPVAVLLCGCSRPPVSIETARRHLELGRYKESEQAARDLLRRPHPPVDSLHVAEILDVLVGALQGQQVHGEESWSLARQAIGIRERQGSAKDPALAGSLRHLGTLHANRGELASAEAVFLRARTLVERAAGARSPLVAPYITEIAIVRSMDGQYDAAIPLYEEALALFAGAAPIAELEMAVTLNGLGIVLYEIGDFARSRDCHERTLEIRTRLLADNANHPKIAESRNNLGILLLEMRDYATALQHFEAVVAIRGQVYGDKHRLVGRGLSNAAVAQRRLDRLRPARQTAQRALTILEGGNDTASTAAVLGTLGAVHQALGEYDKAAACFDRALQIRAARQPTDPYLVVTLEDLARLHHETGDLEAAVGFAGDALALCDSLLSVHHPLVAEYEALRATLFAELQRVDAAATSALRAEEVRAAHLRLTSEAVSDREALLFSGSEERGLSVLLHLATAAATSNAAVRRQAWEALIRSRAIVLDVMVARSRATVLAADPETARLLNELREKSSRYANLAARGVSGDRARYDRSLNELRETKERLEGELARRSRRVQRERERAEIDLDQIELHLPPRSALVAYAALERIGRTASKAPGGRDIVALVLRPEDNSPHLVALGDAARIDTLIAAWNYEAARGVTEAWRTLEESEAACRRAGEALRRAVWDSVAAFVPDSTLVFVVPDAALFRVSFAALPRDDGTYLVESGLRFHYLASERDVVPAARDSTGEGLLALGGAVFDRAAGDARRGPHDEAPCGGLDGIEFAALPGTLQEVEDIASLWSAEAGAGARAGVVALTGTTATDSAFAANAPGKRRLHLATHGFFVDARCAAPAAPGDDAPPPNALHLSGLAFSRPGQKHDSTNDGFLIAEEIAALDLHGVECAVLSACETGVGNVVTGEGILGLRRAFQVAGVRTLIMSLWAVSDEPTRDWMRSLYLAQLKLRLGTVAAVQQAYLRSLEARKRRRASCTPCEACSPHPFFWAGFVAAGEWR